MHSNIWKFFLYSLFQRRHYIVILSVYFLTLANTNAQQIGFYMAAGAIASFLLEIPSGYVSDRFGHKNTLILAQLCVIASTILFLLAQSVVLFTIGSILLSVGFAFASGTNSAFLHNTLIHIGREKEYVKLKSRIGAYVSLLSAVLIIALPFFTTIDIKLPIQINLAFDILGLIVAFSFLSPPQKFKEHVALKFHELFSKGTYRGFFPFIVFTGAITGFSIAEAAYRYPYLESVGYPVVLLGLVMGISRVVWFVVARYAHLLKKVPLGRLMLADAFIFPLLWGSAAFVTNPYVLGAIFSLVVGYQWGRGEVYISTILERLPNPNYKATILSIKGQSKLLFEAAFAFSMGFVMKQSYALGYGVFALMLFGILILSRAVFLRYSLPAAG